MARQRTAVDHRLPLGLLLLSRGHLTEEQLEKSLVAQQAAGHGKIGEWIQRLGYASEHEVLHALAAQWALPVLAKRGRTDGICSVIPTPVQDRMRIIPLRLTRERILYVAVNERMDQSDIAAIEQILDCRFVACLVSDQEMHKLFERRKNTVAPRLFDRPCGSAEMARITASYVSKIGAEEVRIARCGPFAWVRLLTEKETTDLLFAFESVEREIRSHARSREAVVVPA